MSLLLNLMQIAGLVYGEELLRDLDAVQSHANQEVSEVMAMLDELHKNVQKLAPEKHILEAKPKSEEEEGCPLTCRQEESEFKSLQIEPCDADICQLEQNLQEDELGLGEGGHSGREKGHGNHQRTALCTAW